MARYISASEAASIVFNESLADSGDESDIEEDLSFPLPCDEDEYAYDRDCMTESEQPHPSSSLHVHACTGSPTAAPPS